MNSNQLNWKSELKRICEILNDYGIDIQHIPITVERNFVLLKDIKIDGVDIKEIIENNNLDANFPIGKYINKFRSAYNNTKGILTNEERKYGEKLGIVQERRGSLPIFKGRKISQFHIDYVNGMLDKILSGELNTTEALKLLEHASIENNENIIKDLGSIKRIVYILLKDRPEELKQYNEMVKKNSGRRNPYKGKIGVPKIGTYHQQEENFKELITGTYLPKILSGEVTFEMLEKELGTSHQTIDKIIVEFYSQNDNSEGIEKYQKAKKRNHGVSLETRESAKKMRNEVAQYDVVSNAEFLLLSKEEQEKQLIMKIRKEKLKEEKNKKNGQTAVLTEKTTSSRIDNVMNYFRDKNTDEDKIDFSDEDIRYMIFRYPTLISRSNENLDEKIENLTSYQEIDEMTAYGMIKSFPAIMGYDITRTRKQIDLLEKEGLIDYVISKPSGLMCSVNLMYALIEYAKERHHTNDLRGVTRSNIFMSNATLKRLYGTTYDELKERFLYDILEPDEEYIISGKDFGKTKPSILKTFEAENILNNVLENEKSKEKDNEKNDRNL